MVNAMVLIIEGIGQIINVLANQFITLGNNINTSILTMYFIMFILALSFAIVRIFVMSKVNTSFRNISFNKKRD